MEIYFCNVISDLNDLIQYIKYVKRCIIIVHKNAKKNFLPIALDLSKRLSVLINKYNQVIKNPCKKRIQELEREIYFLMNDCKIRYDAYVAFYYLECIDTPFLVYKK